MTGITQRLSRIIRHVTGNAHGMTLFEVLIALAILGIVEGAFLGALQTSQISSTINRDRISAESLAKSQMDYVLAAPYTDPPSYTPLTDPAGYKTYLTPVRFNPLNPGITPGAESGIQKIMVEIRKGSDGSGGSLLIIEDFKYKPGT